MEHSPAVSASAAGVAIETETPKSRLEKKRKIYLIGIITNRNT